MKSATFVLVALALLLGGVGHAKGGPIYNNATDFSPTINPNGVWSYGELAPGATPNASTFSLYPGHGNTAGLNFVGVDNNGLSDPPYVSHNPTNSTITVSSVSYLPGQAGFHPGSNGAYSVYRFTTPSTGSYSVTATFSGLDFQGPTTTDVHVLDNGVSLFDGSVNGFGSSSATTYSGTLSLAAGDHVDFVVGFGANHNYFSDSTALNATLTPAATAVPEPSALTLLGIGAVCSLGYGWRRRRQSA